MINVALDHSIIRSSTIESSCMRSLFRPPLEPLREHRDSIDGTASDDIQSLLVGPRKGQIVGVPRYRNRAQVLALWAEDLNTRRRRCIHTALRVNGEAVPAKSQIGRAVRPLGHDLELGEVAVVLQGPVRLDVKGP